MDEKWIVPSRFKDEDILFMFEALQEFVAMVNHFERGDTEFDQMMKFSHEANQKLTEIAERASVKRLNRSAH